MDSIIHLKNRQQTTDHQQGGSERWSEDPAPLPSQINTDGVDVNNETSTPNTTPAPPEKQRLFNENILALTITIYSALLAFLGGLLTKWTKLKRKCYSFNIYYLIYSVCGFLSTSILVCLCYAELDDDFVRSETTDFGDCPLTEPEVAKNELIDLTLPMVISTVVACLVGSFVISTQKLNLIKISKPRSFSRIIIASTCFLLISLTTFCWYMEIIENPLSSDWLADSFSPQIQPSESTSYFDLEWVSNYFQKEEVTYKSSGWSLISSLFEQPPPKTYLEVIVEYFSNDPPKASLW